MKVYAVIVAAGGSTRFGGQNKLLAPICGVPVIAWSIRAFAEAAQIERVVVVARPEEREVIAALFSEHAPKLDFEVVRGGERRRDSVGAGLRACTSRYAAIHDGARPLITPELIDRTIAAAEGKPGAIVAAPVTDTVKEVVDGVIRRHPDRTRLWAAQTPQVVLRQAWLDAAEMSDNDETDDAAMLDRLGLDCVVVENERPNLKITRPADILIAEALVREMDEPCE